MVESHSGLTSAGCRCGHDRSWHEADGVLGDVVTRHGECLWRGCGCESFSLAPECWCIYCYEQEQWSAPNVSFPLRQRFTVCPECGFKRCPRATHHGWDCTGSNEPGQRGSVYQ